MESSNSYVPDLHLQSPAIDFIDNRLDKYHPAFATPPARYNPVVGGFIVTTVESRPDPPSATMHAAHHATSPQPTGPVANANAAIPPRPLAEPIEALKFWDSIFSIAMTQFTSGSEEPKGRAESGFSIRKKTDWTGVFDQLEAAKHEYSKETGFRGGFRKVYRKLADNVAKPALGATKFVPDVDYVTPVLGAVQVLLEAAQIASKKREEILAAFDDIDMMFSEVELFLQTYQGDKNVENASVDLIAATFQAIESVIGFFTQHILRRMLSATFKREDYQQKITDNLDKVKSKSERLIRQAQNSQTYEMSYAMKDILSRTAHWKWAVQQILAGQNLIRQELKDGFKVIIDEGLRALEANRKAWDEERAYLWDIIHSRSTSPAPPIEADATERHITPQELLDWIDTPDLAFHDLERITERSRVLVPIYEQARAEQLVQARQVKEWIASPTSAQLLVHGAYESRRYVSGLSLFCSSLVRSLADRAPRFIPLIFFCGLHVDDRTDEYTGGLAIIQSLICQLICQYDFDTRMLSHEVSEELIQLGDIDELCSLFGWLVRQLPRYVVLFCLIDGIVYYEREEFEGDMGLVLVSILKISVDQSNRAAVKVLVTSPTKTTSVRLPFPDDLILSMESMPHSNIVASRGRLERQLREGHEDIVEEEESEA